MLFEQPYFIPGHTVERFQQRVEDISRDDVLNIIQKNLQTATEEWAQLYDEKLCIVHSAKHKDQKIYTPILYSDNEDEWPVVMTVTTEGMQHSRKARKNKKKGTKWTEKEQKLLELLRERGYGVRECAKLMHRSHTTIERHIEDKNPRKRWTNKEKTKAINMRAAGKSYEQIAKKLNRTENAVKIYFCRRRKEILSDPEKVKVMQALSFCLSPGRVLRYLRDIDVLRNQEVEIDDIRF